MYIKHRNHLFIMYQIMLIVLLLVRLIRQYFLLLEKYWEIKFMKRKRIQEYFTGKFFCGSKTVFLNTRKQSVIVDEMLSMNGLDQLLTIKCN